MRRSIKEGAREEAWGPEIRRNKEKRISVRGLNPVVKG